MNSHCPICGADCTSRDQTRRHLHVDHRKFDVIDHLLDSVTTPSAVEDERIVEA